MPAGGALDQTRNAATSRVPFRDTVTARMRARPLANSRSSLRVFSCTRTVPTRGRVTCRRSGSTRMAPVVKVTRSRSRPFFANRGNPALFPARFPARDCCQFQ